MSATSSICRKREASMSRSRINGASCGAASPPRCCSAHCSPAAPTSTSTGARRSRSVPTMRSPPTRSTQMVDPWPPHSSNSNIAFNGERMQRRGRVLSHRQGHAAGRPRSVDRLGRCRGRPRSCAGQMQSGQRATVGAPVPRSAAAAATSATVTRPSAVERPCASADPQLRAMQTRVVVADRRPGIRGVRRAARSAPARRSIST